MYNRKKKLKSEIVADELRSRIQSGGFPSGKLPRKRELLQFFKVSQRTIEAALKSLTVEGLIRGVRGTGIFVNNGRSYEEINLTHRLVMVAMQYTGHYYDQFYETIREELLKVSLYPVGYKMNDSLLRLANASTLLSAPIKGVLYYGEEYWKNPFLNGWQNLRTVALGWFDSEGEPPGSAVMIDFEYGGYCLARHFIESGRRRLAFLGHLPSKDMPTSEGFWKNHMSTWFLRGIHRAAREGGVEPPGEFLVGPEPWDDVIMGMMRQKYDGILCISDHLAYWTRISAEKIGLRCPEDYFLSGCYDTPWSKALEFPITTLDTKVLEISKKAIELLNCGERNIVWIKPQVVFRKSSMG